MARDIQEQKGLKILALNEAFDELKEASSHPKNMTTEEVKGLLKLIEEKKIVIIQTPVGFCIHDLDKQKGA